MTHLFYVGTAAFGQPEPPRAIIPLHLSISNNECTLSKAGDSIQTLGENPGYLEYCPSGIIYCGFEDAAGRVQAYSVTAQGTLETLGDAVSSVGRHPCYIHSDCSGRWLLVSNYTEGSVAVLPILEDGSVGEATDSKMHQGGDLIDKTLHDRQEGPHPHSIVVHPSNKWIAVADLGLSMVFVYGFDDVRGALQGAADDKRHLRLQAGAGCRHIVWNSCGDRLFVNNELDCTVTVCAFDISTGSLKEIQTLPTLPTGVDALRAPHRGNSHIALHPNGKFLYVGCRSPDPGLIAIFEIIDQTSPLTLVGHESTRGSIPRNFELHAVEDTVWLVVGNQETMNVVCFAVDEASGKLQFKSEINTSPLKPCNISALVTVDQAKKRRVGE